MTNKREFEPEGGKTKAIVFYTAVPDVLSVQFYLEGNAQREAFEQFYNITTTFGTQPFTFKDPSSGVEKTMRFVGDPPQYRVVGYEDYTAAVDIEVLP